MADAWGGVRLHGISLCLAIGLALACGHSERAALPPGLAIAAETAALGTLLAALAELPDSPVAAEAERLGGALPDCPLVAARAPREAPQQLWTSLACADGEALHPALARILAAEPLAFSLELEAPTHLVGGLRPGADGSVELEATLTRPEASGLLSLLLPAETPAGPARLSARDTLLHARLRPAGGLDLARWVDASSQADRLFRLRSRLFSSAAFDGVWELAMYRPRAGQRIPPVVLAADLASPALAREGIAQFTDELEATWPIHAVARDFGGARGRCFFDLRIMPDFEPCFAVGDELLLIGWNPGALEAALARGAGAAPSGGAALVHLDRLHEADGALRRELTPDAEPAGGPYPWSRLEISATAREGDVAIRARLEERS